MLKISTNLTVGDVIDFGKLVSVGKNHLPITKIIPVNDYLVLQHISSKKEITAIVRTDDIIGTYLEGLDYC